MPHQRFDLVVDRDAESVLGESKAERLHILGKCIRIVTVRMIISHDDMVAGCSTLAQGVGQRIHPAVSRVTMLSEKTPASFIAFDLLALGDDDYTGRPFAERRAALERALNGAKPPIHLTPTTTDVEVAQRWFVELEGAGLDGVVAKPLERHLPA